MDHRGRIADHAIVHALAWKPGTRLDIRETQGLLLIRADSQGKFNVTNQGHLRLPAHVRHHFRLVPGDRVLLAAIPDHELLVIHQPAALDDMLSQRHAGILGGDRA